jgi:hypothetical protein
MVRLRTAKLLLTCVDFLVNRTNFPTGIGFDLLVQYLLISYFSCVEVLLFGGLMQLSIWFDLIHLYCTRQIKLSIHGSWTWWIDSWRCGKISEWYKDVVTKYHSPLQGRLASLCNQNRAISSWDEILFQLEGQLQMIQEENEVHKFVSEIFSS